MSRALLLPLLLLLVSAAPATRPTTNAAPQQRFIVHVRHVELPAKPGEPAAIVVAQPNEPIPADAKERSSLRIAATTGEPFETVAVINGTTYRLAGNLFKPSKATDGKDYFRVKVEYAESRGTEQKSIAQITTNLVLEPDQEVRMGGMMNGPTATALTLALRRPDAAAPAR
jgi:hypothetical protein